MKKILAIVMLCLLICSGCQKEEPQLSSAPDRVTSSDHEVSIPDDGPLWYEKIKCRRFWTYEWAGPVAETAEAFFYIAEDGLWRFDKTTEEDTFITSGELIGAFLYDDLVYYCDGQSIYRLQPDGSDNTMIWDYSMCPEENKEEYDSIVDFQIYDGYLYIRLDGLRIIKHDLDKNTSEFFLEDFNYLAFCGNICYFCDHANRTFSIYRMDMDTGETTMVRGDGKALDAYNKIRYEFAASYHGKLYYLIRGTKDIYQYTEDGDDQMILDVSALDSYVRILNAPGYRNLCYYVDNGTQIALFEYDSEGNTTELLTLSSDENPFFGSSICVTDSAIFWKATEDSAMNCIIKG